MTDRTTRYVPDDRGNRLHAWKLERSGSSWFLNFRSSPETKRHVIGAYPRVVDVGTLKYNDNFPYRVRFDFEPPDELTNFLKMLEKVLVIEVEQKGFLDAAITLDLYRRKYDGQFSDTTIGRLISQAKGYRRVSLTAKDEAIEALSGHMSDVIAAHQWMNQATRILPVPGHDSRIVATSVTLATDVARKVDIPLTEVGCRKKTRESAKQMNKFEREDLLHEFHVDERLDNDTVIVLDDFYHTGWTMAGVAYAAKRAGAKTVLGLAAVRNYQR